MKTAGLLNSKRQKEIQSQATNVSLILVCSEEWMRCPMVVP